MHHLEAPPLATVNPDTTGSFEPVESVPIIELSPQHTNIDDEPFVTTEEAEFATKGSSIELEMSSEELLQAMAEGSFFDV